MKRILVCLLFIFVGLYFMSGNIFNSSFAYQYDKDNSVLFYKNDYNELGDDIKNYLENIDDIIIPNSSFIYSEVLVQNYDFLVYFALDYVLANKEYYKDYIKTFDNFSYMNKEGNQVNTNEYVDINIIYEITDFYFGIKDFVIVNDNIDIKNNHISLINYADDNFLLKIDDLSIYEEDIYVNAVVDYDGINKYRYVFYNDNNVLKLKNVEVIS